MVVERLNVIIFCKVVSLFKVIYKWIYDGIELNLIIKSYRLNELDGNLIVINIIQNEFGGYRCIVSNGFGLVLSLKVEICVVCEYSIEINFFSLLI